MGRGSPEITAVISAWPLRDGADQRARAGSERRGTQATRGERLQALTCRPRSVEAEASARAERGARGWASWAAGERELDRASGSKKEKREWADWDGLGYLGLIGFSFGLVWFFSFSIFYFKPKTQTKTI
jgi:hypothetical protein